MNDIEKTKTQIEAFANELETYCATFIQHHGLDSMHEEDMNFFNNMIAIARQGNWPKQNDLENVDSDPRDKVIELINKHKSTTRAVTWPSTWRPRFKELHAGQKIENLVADNEGLSDGYVVEFARSYLAAICHPESLRITSNYAWFGCADDGELLNEIKNVAAGEKLDYWRAADLKRLLDIMYHG